MRMTLADREKTRGSCLTSFPASLVRTRQGHKLLVQLRGERRLSAAARPSPAHKCPYKRTLIGMTGRWLPSTVGSNRSEPMTSGNTSAARPSVVMDLVEAAVRTGRRKEAVAHVEAARAANVGRSPPALPCLRKKPPAAQRSSSTDPSRRPWRFLMRDCGHSTGARRTRLRRTAPTSQADSCGSHKARRRTRHVRASRCTPLGAAGRERAARHRHHHRTPRAHPTRSAVAAAAGDRTTRGRGPKQQGDRGAAVPVTPNGRLAPVPDLPECFADAPPADVLLLCGIFGNVSADDIERTQSIQV